MTDLVQPDFDWYRGTSTDLGLPPRCPYASVHRCPRYYMSMSLLGQACLTTSLEEKLEKELRKRWEKSELWPVILEQTPCISGSGENPNKSFTHFCPEVSYDAFGWFASGLHRYTDDIDKDVAHSQLANEGASGNDHRWAWWMLSEKHYSECPLYSPLAHRKSQSRGHEDTRFDKLVRRAKDNPVISVIIVVFLVISAVAGLILAFKEIFR